MNSQLWTKIIIVLQKNTFKLNKWLAILTFICKSKKERCLNISRVFNPIINKIENSTFTLVLQILWEKNINDILIISDKLDLL